MPSPQYTCPDAPPTSCILFTGSELTFPAEGDELQCDAKLDDVIFKIDKYLFNILTGSDLTGLDKKYLIFDPATITVAGLEQIEIDALDVLNGQVASLTTQLNNLDIGNEVVTVNLGAMSPAVSACAVGTNEYQLKVVLQLFADKLNDFETRISNLEP